MKFADYPSPTGITSNEFEYLWEGVQTLSRDQYLKYIKELPWYMGPTRQQLAKELVIEFEQRMNGNARQQSSGRLK